MTRTHQGKPGRQHRHISVRAIRRDPPDMTKLGRALVQEALRQAAAEAEAEQQAKRDTPTPPQADEGAQDE